MPDPTAWEEYCEASLDLSNQDDVGEEREVDRRDQTLNLEDSNDS